MIDELRRELSRLADGDELATLASRLADLRTAAEPAIDEALWSKVCDLAQITPATRSDLPQQLGRPHPT